MIQFSAIDIVGDELELLQLAGGILQSRLFAAREQKKFMVNVQVTSQPNRMPIDRDQMIGKSGLGYTPPKEFSLLLPLANGLADALDMLAHELIHIAQLRAGRLRITRKKMKINGVRQMVHLAKWGKAKPVIIDQTPYHERGWEIEAHQWHGQLRIDAISLLLGAPHHQHLQSAKGELALFEAVAPVPQSQASGQAQPQPQPQPQMAPQMQPPQMAPQMPAAQPQMTPQMAPQIAPQMPAAQPQMAPQMQPPQMAQQMAPQMQPPQMAPQMQAPQMAPQMPAAQPQMQPPQMAPQMPAEPRVVKARAVARPAASELPAMPEAPLPVEPTSFKAADPEMVPEPIVATTEATPADLGAAAVAEDNGMAEAPLADSADLDAALVSEIEDVATLTPPAFGAEPESASVMDDTDIAAALDDADDSDEAALAAVADMPADDTEDMALDDDVLAALMAEDTSDAAADIPTEAVPVQKAEPDDAALAALLAAETDDSPADMAGTGDTADVADPVEDEDLAAALAQSEPAVAPEIAQEVAPKATPAAPPAAAAAKPAPLPEPQAAPEVDYEEFGAAPDLSGLNAQATDRDKAFQDLRLVDVAGLDEKRVLQSDSVDAKLKDLQSRGLADSDIKRAKQSEELT